MAGGERAGRGRREGGKEGKQAPDDEYHQPQPLSQSFLLYVHRGTSTLPGYHTTIASLAARPSTLQTVPLLDAHKKEMFSTQHLIVSH